MQQKTVTKFFVMFNALQRHRRAWVQDHVPVLRYNMGLDLALTLALAADGIALYYPGT